MATTPTQTELYRHMTALLTLARDDGPGETMGDYIMQMKAVEVHLTLAVMAAFTAELTKRIDAEQTMLKSLVALILKEELHDGEE